ncbi:MAG TPA: 7-carboxy-7-deazaguanine synthase QueE [Candidatus Nitrosocosmicus sp.]|nr:7-carboxy-7-deazaguanine synthase QueE [Candidatus Nitrosocosmicus sp.]
MRISEIFYSIQGEGRLSGVPSVFIRTSGCNLRCVWCDTPYTSWSPDGKEMSLDEILHAVESYPLSHVVLTGGEPLLSHEIEELSVTLKTAGAHVTIETAATIFKPVSCDLVSMSPKLSNSTPWQKQNGRFAAMHDQHRLNYNVVQRFIDRYDYQLKFVVDREQDFAEVRQIVDALKNVDTSRVLIMAQARNRRQLHQKSRWIVELCKKFGYGYSPRLHIELYGNRRGV